MDTAFAQIAADFGRIDILVNGARSPVQADHRLAEINSEQFWADMNVKVMGYLRCARAAAPHMEHPELGQGFINISGLAARQTGSTIGSMQCGGSRAHQKPRR